MLLRSNLQRTCTLVLKRASKSACERDKQMRNEDIINEDIIKAWKDPELRASLSDGGGVKLPPHPSGELSALDATLGAHQAAGRLDGDVPSRLGARLVSRAKNDSR